MRLRDPHEHPPQELHGGEDVGEGEEEVQDLLVAPELPQQHQDVVEGGGGIGMIFGGGSQRSNCLFLVHSALIPLLFLVGRHVCF